MRATPVMLAVLLVSIPVYARAGEQQPAEVTTPDSRVPVEVTPEESVRQKTEMRNNLVALRDLLANLAASDFAGVETAARRLAHVGPVAARPGVSMAVFADLERQFERSVDKTVEAARSGNTAVVLRATSDTIAYCQSCHMAFRQAVGKARGKTP